VRSKLVGPTPDLEKRFVDTRYPTENFAVETLGAENFELKISDKTIWPLQTSDP